MNVRLIKENKNYRASLCATITNRFGDSVDALCMSWFMYQLTSSASLSALLYAINYIPTIIFQPICGGFVTKHNRKTIMITADTARGLLVAVIAFLLFFHQIQPWMLFVFSFLISTFEAFRLPCTTKVITEIVEKSDYSSAQALNKSCESIVTLIGTAMAGFILNLGGVPLGLCIDAISFLSSAFFLSFLKIHFEPLSEDKNTIELVKEGFAYIRHRKEIILIGVIALLINALAIPMNSLGSAWCTELFQRGPDALSILNASYVIGTIIGSTIYTSMEGKLKLSVSMKLCYTGIGIFYLSWIFGAVFHENDILFYLFIIVLPIITGIIIAWANIILSVTMMKIIDSDYLSRVDSVINALCQAGIPVSSLITSVLSAFLPLFSVFMIFLFLSVICAIVISSSQTLHSLENVD